MRVIWLLLAGAAAEDALDCFSRGGGCAECCSRCTPYLDEIQSGRDTGKPLYGNPLLQLNKFETTFVNLLRRDYVDDDGRCVCVDATDKVLHNVNIRLTDHADCITVRGFDISIKGRAGDDVIVARDSRAGGSPPPTADQCDILLYSDPESRFTIRSGRGDDSISLEGSHSFVFAGNDDDYVLAVGDKNLIHGDDGDDLIEVSGNGNDATGGFGDDDLRGNDAISLLSLDPDEPCLPRGQTRHTDYENPMILRPNRLFGGEQGILMEGYGRHRLDGGLTLRGWYQWPPSDADRCNDGPCLDTRCLPEQHYKWAYDEFGGVLPGNEEHTLWYWIYYGDQKWLEHEYTLPDQCPWSDADID